MKTKNRIPLLPIVVGAAITAAAMQSAGAAVIYKFDFNESAGTYANGGSGGVGTIDGNGTYGADQSGVSGNSGDRAFNNTAGAGRVLTPDTLGALSSLTLSFWYRVDDASARLGAGTQLISGAGFTLRGDESLNANETGIRFQHAGNAGTPTQNPVSTLFTGSGYDLDNEWVFAAMTFSGSSDTATSDGTVNFYTGSKTTGVSLAGTFATNVDALNTFTTSLSIGNRGGAATNRNFTSLIDSFQIDDTVLTSAQLDGLRLAAIPEPSVALLSGLGLLALMRRRRA